MKALIRTSYQHDYAPEMLEAVEAVNNRQKRVLLEKVVRKFGEDLRGKRFAVWGLAMSAEIHQFTTFEIS